MSGVGADGAEADLAESLARPGGAQDPAWPVGVVEEDPAVHGADPVGLVIDWVRQASVLGRERPPALRIVVRLPDGWRLLSQTDAAEILAFLLLEHEQSDRLGDVDGSIKVVEAQQLDGTAGCVGQPPAKLPAAIDLLGCLDRDLGGPGAEIEVEGLAGDIRQRHQLIPPRSFSGVAPDQSRSAVQQTRQPDGLQRPTSQPHFGFALDGYSFHYTISFLVDVCST